MADSPIITDISNHDVSVEVYLPVNIDHQACEIFIDDLSRIIKKHKKDWAA